MSAPRRTPLAVGYTAAIVVAAVAVLIVRPPSLASPSGGPATIDDALGLRDVVPSDLAARRSAAIAEATSRCMAAHGFGYAAVPEPGPAIPGAHLGPVEWAERWGFGISTSVGMAVPPLPVDPNVVALASWPAADRDAYLAALYGDTEAPGCLPAASDEVLGLRDRLLAPLALALADLDARVAADPRQAAVADAWHRCVEVIGGIVEVRDLAREDAVGLLLDWFGSRVEASQPFPATLRAVQDDERRVAAAVARCDLDVATAKAAIRAPHEAAFVATHGPELTAIGAAIRRVEAAYPVPVETDLP